MDEQTRKEIQDLEAQAASAQKTGRINEFNSLMQRISKLKGEEQPLDIVRMAQIGGYQGDDPEGANAFLGKFELGPNFPTSNASRTIENEAQLREYFRLVQEEGVPSYNAANRVKNLSGGGRTQSSQLGETSPSGSEGFASQSQGVGGTAEGGSGSNLNAEQQARYDQLIDAGADPQVALNAVRQIGDQGSRGAGGGANTSGMTPEQLRQYNQLIQNGADPQTALNAVRQIPGGNPDAVVPGTGGVDLSGLPPEFQELYGQLDTYLTELEERGKAINPNITISEDKLQEFAAQASAEIDPFYSNLLKQSVSNFLADVGYSASQILENERRLEREFGRSARSLAEGAADIGFAQSGIRQRGERQLAEGFRGDIEQGREQLQFAAQQAARGLAGEFGGENVPAFNIGRAPTVSPGERTFGDRGSSTPLFSLSDSVFDRIRGTRQFEQDAAKRRRVSELESAERSRLGLGQQRQLL